MCIFVFESHTFICKRFVLLCFIFVFFFMHKTAYELRISGWSSDVCSSYLVAERDAIPVPAGIEGRDKLELQTYLYHLKHADAELGRLVKLDRKSVVEGKSGSVRVDHGGSRNHKKKTAYI